MAVNGPEQPGIASYDGGHPPSRTRILLADDNPAFLDCVAHMLTGDGYDVVGGVADGTRVVAEAERLRPDVLILDISMGEVSGLELARLLQQDEFAGKVVFLTVYEDQDFVSAAMRAGGAAYVVKSRLDLDLPAAIQAALSGRLFVSDSLRQSLTNKQQGPP